jgi:hypothetical protein
VSTAQPLGICFHRWYFHRFFVCHKNFHAEMIQSVRAVLLNASALNRVFQGLPGAPGGALKMQHTEAPAPAGPRCGRRSYEARPGDR